MRAHVHVYFDSDHFNKSEYRNVRGISVYQNHTVLYLHDNEQGEPQSPINITQPIYNVSAFEQDE